MNILLKSQVLKLKMFHLILYTTLLRREENVARLTEQCFFWLQIKMALIQTLYLFELFH